MDAIKCIYGSSSDSEEDKDDEICDIQFVRAFPHVKGNWPSHVYIQINPSFSLFPSIPSSPALLPREDWHISLSKPFVLKKSQIDPFVSKLKQQMRWKSW